MLREIFVTGARERHSELADKAKQAAKAYLDSYAGGDIDARLRLFAPDATFEDPVGTPVVRGHAALRTFWEGAAGLNVIMTLEHVAASGNTCAMVFTASLSVAGDAVDQASVRVIETVEVDDAGLIRAMRAYFDEEAIS